MSTIFLPDGYNGHMVECYAKPIWSDGVVAKLSVVGSPHLIRYVLVKNLPPGDMTGSTGFDSRS